MKLNKILRYYLFTIKKNRVSIQATHRLTVKRYEENPF